MAKLKETYVSGNLWITGSSTFVSASEFRGPLNGTASIANNLNPSNSYTVQGLTVGGVGGASGSAHIHGDLKVDGDLIYVGVQDLRVKDKTIELNANESGSAVQDADGAGIVIRNSSAEGDISILYDKASDSLVINKPISGSMTRAATASVAEKVKFALSFGSGISKSAASYNGSAGVTISLDTASVKNIKVNSASKADWAKTAATASSTQESLALAVYTLAGSESVSFDGSSGTDFSVDLRGLERSIISASASITNLNADIDIACDNVPVSGGVYVITDIPLVQEAGLVRVNGDVSGVEVVPIGKFVPISASVKRLETSASYIKSTYLTTASFKTYSSSVSNSLTDIYNTLAEMTGSGTGSVEQQIEAAINNITSSAEFSPVDTPVSGGVMVLDSINIWQEKGVVVDPTIVLPQDPWTGTSSFTAVEVEKAGAAAKLSASLKTFTAISASVKRLETSASVIKSTYTTTASFNAYTSSANGRLTALESASASLDDKYIKKTGDVVSGSLVFVPGATISLTGSADEDTGIDMTNTAISFGNMKIFYNYTDGAIEFAPII